MPVVMNRSQKADLSCLCKSEMMKNMHGQIGLKTARRQMIALNSIT